MMRRWLSGLALVAVVVVTLLLAAGGGSDDSSAAARTRRITADLRCPTCQGLSVADSPSEISRAITDDVRARIEAGESDSEIRGFYVDKYGEWILLKPPSEGLGALVWALPAAAVALGAGGLALAFRRWRRQPTLPADDDDRLLVEHARLQRLEDAP